MLSKPSSVMNTIITVSSGMRIITNAVSLGSGNKF